MFYSVLLFNSRQLDYFVNVTHAEEMKIFFALSFTNDSQRIPDTIYVLGENGISLDMSTLDIQDQADLLSTLQSNYQRDNRLDHL